jgi:hypothetical protein
MFYSYKNIKVLLLIIIFSFLNISSSFSSQYNSKFTLDLENISKNDNWNNLKSINWSFDSNKIIFSTDTGIYALSSKNFELKKLFSSKEIYNNPNFIDENRISFISEKNGDPKLNIYSLKTKKIEKVIKNTCDYYISNKYESIIALTDNGIKKINLLTYNINNITNFNTKVNFKEFSCSITSNYKNNDIYYINKSKNNNYPAIYRISNNSKIPTLFYKIDGDSSDYKFSFLNISNDNSKLIFNHSIGISYLNMINLNNKKTKILSGGEINGKPQIHSVLDDSIWFKDSKNILFIGEFYNSEELSTKLFNFNIENNEIKEIEKTENIRKISISNDKNKIAFFKKNTSNKWNLVIKEVKM